jgi:hypothetical protein
MAAKKKDGPPTTATDLALVEALEASALQDQLDELRGPVHISRLRLMNKSAAHYAAGFDGTETYAMERGTALHAMLLGGARVCTWNGKTRQGDDYDAFVRDNPDAVVLTRAEGAKVLAMATSVRRCREAMRVLDGDREKTIRWRIGDRECEGTPDVDGGSFVTELKSCPSSDPRQFKWHARRMGYHAQLPWYSDGLMLSGKPGRETHYIVAVEAVYPFVTTVLTLTAGDMDKGRRLYRTWWEQLAVCEASNEYPPYAQGVVELDLPDDAGEIDFGDDEAAA